MPILDQLTNPISYCPQTEDTSLAMDIFEFQQLRQRSNVERLQMAAILTKRARQISLRGLKLRFGSLSQNAFACKVAQAWLQEDCPSDFMPSGSESMWIQDPLEIAVQLHNLLIPLQIDYYITGGASAVMYGEPRTTRDIDLVLAISLSQLDSLVMELEKSGFYIGGLDEVRSGESKILQVIQMDSISRADLMIAGESAFDLIQFERKQAIEVWDSQVLFYASAEDVVLNKLKWRLQSASEKQWRDVLGILKVQGDLLDVGYLREWASVLGVLEDLNLGMEQVKI
ncbi:MAG: hypothetical protein IM537_17835 [Pseudanabaena sp. M57BS1SP1A06MG]|jgi:hypothetical protein|nr:hypothetical protein [Pseudanabaena sp. M53BS1SP1A06MG]MCA6582708.1 hypothetical protein [Pseudanabaena sp. M34BS1SP1A06MG]MCA6592991.1 hypothetical protein [Pseudanabaena sp. M38BS1SP1A06MG]MCA6602013.1 hypothetical protein [Pseudanabaena sp. M57BS1SP1A06MG]